MVYHALTSRTLLALCAAGLALACNPDKGDDTSASESSGNTSGATTGTATTPTTDGPTTGEATTSATSGATTDLGTTGEPGTTTTASETTNASSTTVDTSETGGDTTGGAALCGDDPEFTASWNAWQAALETNGDTYYYSVIRGISGFGPPDYCLYRTTVIVVDGAVVERRFVISEMVGDPQDCEMSFVEKGAEVGNTFSGFAAAPVTVDALYTACCEQVIHIEPAEEYMVTFEVDKDGLMHQCFYVANGCADGCDGGPLGPSLEFEVLAFGAAPPAP